MATGVFRDAVALSSQKAEEDEGQEEEEELVLPPPVRVFERTRLGNQSFTHIHIQSSPSAVPMSTTPEQTWKRQSSQSTDLAKHLQEITTQLKNLCVQDLLLFLLLRHQQPYCGPSLPLAQHLSTKIHSSRVQPRFFSRPSRRTLPNLSVLIVSVYLSTYTT